jgi:SAM-dependent methyltransferase
MLKLDTSRYVFGKPDLIYQPLPWLGVQEARRSRGTKDRAAAILTQIKNSPVAPQTAMDIGCNVGYFALTLVEHGLFVYAIDSSESNLAVARAANRKIRGNGWFAPLELMCTPDNTRHLPSVDIMLVLSVWHHWVRYFGVDAATSMLQQIWRKTRVALFFDTGEDEMPAHYALPFEGADPTQWLERYLVQLCSDGEVFHLGRFAAFAPGGREKVGEIARSLFMVRRVRATPN